MLHSAPGGAGGSAVVTTTANRAYALRGRWGTEGDLATAILIARDDATGACDAHAYLIADSGGDNPANMHVAAAIESVALPLFAGLCRLTFSVPCAVPQEFWLVVKFDAAINVRAYPAQLVLTPASDTVTPRPVAIADVVGAGPPGVGELLPDWGWSNPTSGNVPYMALDVLPLPGVYRKVVAAGIAPKIERHEGEVWGV